MKAAQTQHYRKLQDIDRIIAELGTQTPRRSITPYTLLGALAAGLLAPPVSFYPGLIVVCAIILATALLALEDHKVLGALTIACAALTAAMTISLLHVPQLMGTFLETSIPALAGAALTYTILARLMP